jgi:GAF domain-containing protein
MNEELAQANTAEAVYQTTLDLMRKELNPERALVFYGYDQDDSLTARAGIGIDITSVYLTGEISLSILQETLEAGEPRVLVDAQEDPRFGDRTSTLLSGIRSVLCCPMRDAQGIVGLLYVDNRLQKGVFKEDHLKWISGLADAVVARVASL